MTKLKMESKDLTQYNIEQIAQLFPQVVTEVADPSGAKESDGKPVLKKAIDFDKLKLVLSAGTGDYAIADDEREHYEFTWVGKRQSMIDATTPIRKTLRPCVEESKDWDTTENLYIEGDNLEVLKLLQESYLGKVKMIYIDPPYNTGKDFVYKDNFKQDSGEYNEELGMYDEEDNRLFQNNETNGRFHSDWCSMIYPRLQLARNLLTEDGVVFISIDDNEVENIKKICDEVFGASNFIANIIWQTSPGSNTGVNIITVTEYVIVYAKNKNICQFNTVEITDSSKYILYDEYEKKRGKYILNKLDRRMTGVHYSEALNYPIEMPDGQLIYPGSTSYRNNDNWNYRWSQTKVNWGITNGFIVFKNIEGKWNAYFKQYFKVDNNDNDIIRSLPYQNYIPLNKFNSTQGTKEIMSIFEKKYFDYPKPSGFIKHLLQICQKPNDIILDFFSGSSTTAHAVMQLNAEDGGNRKFIMVQLPETTDKKSEAYKAGYKNICEIGKERIRRAGEKVDQVRIDKINKKAEKEGVIANIKALDTGFRVFKTDSTNMKDVYYAAGKIFQTKLFDMVSNIKENRSDIDLLYGCLLDWGVPLSQPHRSENIEGSTVHFVNDTNLVACFDDKITEQTVRTIAALKPLRALFRDHSFENSANKINVYEIFKSISPDTSVKVI